MDDIKAAEYLLRFFPGLWEKATYQADDALEGGSHGDYSSAGIRAEGTYSDPTMGRAMSLYEAHDLIAKLDLVRRWIDIEMPNQDRNLLLAVWRSNQVGGWWWVVHETSMGVDECRKNWSKLVKNLADWLTGI